MREANATLTLLENIIIKDCHEKRTTISLFFTTDALINKLIKCDINRSCYEFLMNILQRGLHLRHRYPTETSVVSESSERLEYLLTKNYFPIRLSVDIRLATVDDRIYNQINFRYSSI